MSLATTIDAWYHALFHYKHSTTSRMGVEAKTTHKSKPTSSKRPPPHRTTSCTSKDHPQITKTSQADNLRGTGSQFTDSLRPKAYPLSVPEHLMKNKQTIDSRTHHPATSKIPREVSTISANVSKGYYDPMQQWLSEPSKDQPWSAVKQVYTGDKSSYRSSHRG